MDLVKNDRFEDDVVVVQTDGFHVLCWYEQCRQEALRHPCEGYIMMHEEGGTENIQNESEVAKWSFFEAVQGEVL